MVVAPRGGVGDGRVYPCSPPLGTTEADRPEIIPVQTRDDRRPQSARRYGVRGPGGTAGAIRVLRRTSLVGLWRSPGLAGGGRVGRRARSGSAGSVRRGAQRVLLAVACR